VGRAADGNWYVILEAFLQAEVRWPVLCAIGCGAFIDKPGGGGQYTDVPGFWADALVHVLRNPTLAERIDGVIVCIPTFNEAHARAFGAALGQPRGGGLAVPVLVLRNHGVVEVAEWIANQNKRAGLLNPSDVQAVRQGAIGMYWHHGHIALEEILALQTTLLMQHANVNANLWADVQSRHRDVSGQPIACAATGCPG
jgi:hypothetical protein